MNKNQKTSLLSKKISKANKFNINPIEVKITNLKKKIFKMIAVNEISLLRQSKQTANLQIKVNQKILIPEYILKPKKIKQKEKPLQKTENKKIIKKKLLTNKVDSDFIWPVKGKILNRFGSETPGFFNDGINISSNLGTSVKASLDGEIVYSGNEIPGYGNLILIKHSKNWITAYAHLEKIVKKKGNYVKKGETIGLVGKTGNVSEVQLHFEIRKGKEAVNPLKYLS